MGRKKAHLAAKGKYGHTPAPRKRDTTLLCEKLFKLCSDVVDVSRLWDNYKEIVRVLADIERMQDMKFVMTPRNQAIDRFMKWLTDNGAEIHGVSLAEFPGYDMGVKADRHFNANDIAVEIPRKLIMSTETAAPEMMHFQNDPLIQHMPQVALAMALLIEKHKPNSKWKPYIDVLPTKYSTVLYMSTDEMAELKGSPTLELAMKQCRNIVRQFVYFDQMFHNLRNAASDLLRPFFTWEEYRWAVSTIMTRQNLIPSKNATDTMIHALIPMWDMCNHEEGVITTDFDLSTETCVCYAKRTFTKGEQIFINYGPRSNSEFFVHSGFVYPDNQHDEFKLKLGISRSDSLYVERFKLLKKLDFTSHTVTFSLIPGTEPISEALLSFLRVFSMGKVDLKHWYQSGRIQDLKHRDCALNTVVEANARKFLLTRLQLLIANYPTTLEEDLLLIETPMPRERLVPIQMRIVEKKILLGALEYVEQWMKS